MRIVAAADLKAKESRRALEQEVLTLKAELADKEETYQFHMEQVDANMRLHFRHLQEITNQFLAAHRESTELIRATAVEREEIESRALAHVKQILYNFTKYMSWNSSRKQRASVFACARHFNHPAKALISKLKTSPMPEIQKLVRGGYLAIHQSCNELDDPSSSEQLMSDFLEGNAALPDDSTLGVESLIDNLLDKPGGMGRAVAALVLPQMENASCSELGGAAHAVVLYLLGAADVLDRFGDRISGSVLEFVAAIQQAREAQLLNKERDIFKDHAKSIVGTGNVEVSQTPIQLLLTQQIATAAAERMVAVTSLLRDACQSLSTTLAEQLRDTRQALWDLVLPSLSDGLFMNETQFRSHLLASSREGRRQVASREVPDSGSAAPQPPVVVSALYRVAAASSGLVDKIMIHVHEEQQKTLRRVHTEMALQMDKVMKSANTQRNIVMEQHTTEMRLDDIRADIRHQQFMRSLTLEREAKLSARTERDIVEHRTEIDRLRISLEKLQRENETLKQRCAMAEAETTLLREVATHRHRNTTTLTVVQQDTKTVNYVVNQGTFGETWQESLLRLRERILGELSSDNARFLAKLRSFLQRKQVDYAQIEQLYETRLQATVAQINQEHETQVQWLRRRYEMEIASLKDNQALIVANLKETSDKERVELCRHYEDAYLERVKEMNEQYARRLRQLASREKGWEDQLAVAQRRLRSQFRVRENELEGKISDRQEDMRRVFDDDSMRVKEQFVERQRELERSHLQATAKLEAQLNERSQAVQKQFELLSVRLQEDVLRFVGEKQSFFDSFRANELELIASFMHKKESMTAAQYENILETQRARDAEEVAIMRAEHKKEMEASKAVHQEESSRVVEEARQRLVAKAAQADQTFRVCQDLHVQNDDAFWERCREYLVRGEEAIAERKETVEVETQRRYHSLIDQCQAYLSKDIASARESFNMELSQRYDAIHASCRPLQRTASQLQYDLWEEHHRRSFMYAQEAVERAYTLSMCDESRMFLERRRFFSSIREGNNELSTQVSTEDMRALREKFDLRLAEEHSYIANLTRDTMSTLEVSLEATHSATQQFQEAQRQQLVDVSRLLQQKQEAYDAHRSRQLQERYACMLEFFTSSSQRHFHQTAQQNIPLIGEHIVQTSREWAESVSSATRRWEANLDSMEQQSRKRLREAFAAMHEEYISTTTSLMSKLEASEATIHSLAHRQATMESVTTAQASELRAALSLVKERGGPSKGINNSLLQLEAARQVSHSREALFASDLRNAP